MCLAVYHWILNKYVGLCKHHKYQHIFVYIDIYLFLIEEIKRPLYSIMEHLLQNGS